MSAFNFQHSPWFLKFLFYPPNILKFEDNQVDENKFASVKWFWQADTLCAWKCRFCRQPALKFHGMQRVHVVGAFSIKCRSEFEDERNQLTRFRDIAFLMRYTWNSLELRTVTLFHGWQNEKGKISSELQF